MRRSVSTFVPIAIAAIAAPLIGAPAAAGAAECVTRAELDGAVSPATADYLVRAVDRAEERCAALLVRVDTPGGDLASTRRIVRRFLDAEVPVIAHVAPAGARAGSAGLFITLAAHIAAMAPSTTIGAAHPVVATGQDPEEAGGEHLGRKVENDAASLARALAERHDRDVDWVESAVRDSRMATAAEALDRGVIDLIAAGEAEVLERVDGREVSAAGEAVVLATAGASIEAVEMTTSESARAALGHPNVIFLLVLVGFLGLAMELYNPGLIIPGVTGGLCLVLAAIGSAALPVNAGAVILIAAAIALLIAEIHITSYGVLGLGAAGCLLLGSALLIDSGDPGFYAGDVSVSWTLIAPLVALLAGAAVLLSFKLARSQAARSATGPEGLVGARGEAVTEVGPTSGRVRVSGELWSAIGPGPIDAGDPIEVTAVDGLVLKVAPPRERNLK